MKKTFRRKTLRRKTLRRKTLRRKTLRRKTLRRKTLRRKMRGGFDVVNKGTWSQVVFNDEEKAKIKQYVIDNSDRTVPSTEIRDNLFPDMSNDVKDNAAYEIQVVLGRAYSGN
jgi:hypothetical protein